MAWEPNDYGPHSRQHVGGANATGDHRRITKKFQTSVPGLYITISIPDYLHISKKRKFSNPWPEVKRALEYANREMAVMLQIALVEQYKRGAVQSRSEARTGRLEDALGDPRNLAFEDNGGVYRFGVGVPSWMDRSPAQAYWRAIERGSSASVGRRLPVGVWLDGRGGHMYPSMQGRNSDTRVSNKQMSLMAGFSRFGLQHLHDVRNRNNQSVVDSPVVRNPIDPQEFYEKTWHAKKTSLRAMAKTALRRAMIEVLGIPSRDLRGKSMADLKGML